MATDTKTTPRPGGRPDGATRPAIKGLLSALAAAAALAAIVWAVWMSRRPREAVIGPEPAVQVRTDPNLIVCEEVGEGFATGFAKSRAIATGPDGTVYVSGDRSVRRFDAGGKQLGQMETAGPAGALAVGEDGTVYVVTDSQVRIHGPDGRERASWGAAGDNPIVTAVAVIGTDIFLADAGGRIVLRYDASGKLLGRIGERDPDRNIPGFIVPSAHFDLATGSDRLLRAINPGRHLVEAYTPDGDRESWWGKFSSGPSGFGGCCNPVNLAVLPAKHAGSVDGFVTCEKGPTRVKIHDAEGKFIGIVAAPELFKKHDELLFGKPAGTAWTGLDVAVDKAGRIFVLDPVANAVRIFKRKPRPASAADDGTES